MIIANPFTGMIINANPEGCNQYSGPNCHYQSILALSKASKVPIIYGGPDQSYLELGRIFGSDAKIGGVAFPDRIEVIGGVGHREVAAHEIGHHELGHVEDSFEGDSPEKISQQEIDAWKWAIKHRKKFALSKRKMLRLTDPKDRLKIKKNK